MSKLLSITAQDRVLILAPHPDDESLSSGGLIQASLAAGAAVRVLLFTDGDNNPWPQRWIEKRWVIGAAERMRWGARRRAEAQQALRILGVADDHVRFLGFPDTGLTELLMRADSELMQTLVGELREFRSTRLVVPGLQDRHPDHSATHVLARIAMQHADPTTAIEVLSYLVHTDLTELPSTRVLTLTSPQIQRKREAIAAHETQVRLSGKRFLGFAKPHEYFITATINDAGSAAHDHAEWRAGELLVHLRGRVRRGEELLLALLTAEGASLHARLDLPLSAGTRTLHDEHTDRVIGQLQISVNTQATLLVLQPELGAKIDVVFAKRQKKRRGLMVFDRAGWFEATRENH
ncbi:PIG-L family deacetylase [Pseudolysobacter antarcticus]|uniref:PIG-L family deacetylase n=1 Tax=Pseudolysobacter antarcticus TaxID=2511995 RepID=A0A411HID2_9GAMM|nr:PIG-L family deacetylase [Pseudolysobacter antarcticus]QBB70265.1 PIG-L family deacetylase [Pseudolysobacter antarcticus]